MKMIKNIIITITIIVSSVLHAQKISRKDVMGLTTVEDAKVFLEKVKSKKNKLITFNEAKHRTTLAKELFELPEGGLKIVKKEFYDTYYKILEKKEILSYRVSHITLNNRGMDDQQMRLLMDKIIKEYENGLPFDVLVREYSIDEDNVSYGGDTGWFVFICPYTGNQIQRKAYL